jgi:MOSC domain-containing protein YiiM
MREPNLSSLLVQRPGPGRLTWIGIRSTRGAEVESLQEVELITERGLSGDYTCKRGAGGKRQVSLLQAEHLPVIAQLARRPVVTASELRRNLVVEGINLLALRSRAFRIGEVLLHGTGTCDPCSKMERALGVGGYNAVRGHGGILARVVRGGIVRAGDEVDFMEE